MDLQTSRVLISQAIDFVVYCDQVRTGTDTQRRVVSTVLEVTGFDGVVQASEIFSLVGDHATYTCIAVSRQGALADAGWDPLNSATESGRLRQSRYSALEPVRSGIR